MNYSVKIGEIRNWTNSSKAHFTVWTMAVEPPLKEHSVVWIFHCEKDKRFLVFAKMENFNWTQNAVYGYPILKEESCLTTNTIDIIMSLLQRPLISSTRELK